MKYLFFTVLILFIYRTLFRPKVIVEHRHIYDKPNEKKSEKKSEKKNNKLGDLTDYEEVK
jgi:hypothetical protein